MRFPLLIIAPHREALHFEGEDNLAAGLAFVAFSVPSAAN